jgi:hypothetical protein
MSQIILLLYAIITFPNSVRPPWCSVTRAGDTDTLSTGDPSALWWQDYNFSQVLTEDEGKKHMNEGEDQMGGEIIKCNIHKN